MCNFSQDNLLDDCNNFAINNFNTLSSSLFSNFLQSKKPFLLGFPYHTISYQYMYPLQMTSGV